MRNSVEGIKKRGRSDVGDKTLLDALVPAINELESVLGSGADGHTALERMASVARASADATASDAG